MKVNYISEINAFYSWLDTNPTLSASARHLWDVLMHFNNSCGWKEEFTVSLSRLEDATGYKRDTIYTARNALVQHGRIRVTQRKGNKSAIYSMIFFSDSPVDNSGANNRVSDKPTHAPTHTPTQTPTHTPTQSPTITKLDKTRVDIGGGAARARSPQRVDHDPDFGEVIKAFSDNINPVTPLQAEDLMHLYEEYGKDRVIWAIREGARNNARSLRYIERVLERWRRGEPSQNSQGQPKSAADLYADMAAVIPDEGDDPEKIAAWLQEEGVDLDAITKSSGHGAD